MNGVMYRKVQRDHLVDMFSIQSATVFMHDSAPCHRSAKIKRFLQSKRIPVLKWPGNSSDLNPIMNLWYDLKRKVHEAQPRNLEEMKDVICREWVKIDPDYCRNLAASMLRRIKAIMKVKGSHSKY